MKFREICNKKYGMNLCLFETTSLSGSTQGVSQYDGMKQFIRFQGVTDSDMIPNNATEKIYRIKRICGK
jgi:hypothetical protein